MAPLEEHAVRVGLPTPAWRVRVIGAFEAIKGFVALALMLGIVSTLGESLNEAAQELVLGLHVDPSQPIADALIDATSGISRRQTWLVIITALAYAALRFTEAYGLWTKRRWAAWVAALSGAIYLPVEAYELSQRLSWAGMVAAMANIAIVAYMAWLLWVSRAAAAKLPAGSAG